MSASCNASTTGAAPGAPTPEPGPVGEVRAHVALVPMLRLGPYVAHDIGLLSGAPARGITEAGAARQGVASAAHPVRGGAGRSSVSGTPARTSRATAWTGGGRLRPREAGGFLETRVGLGVGYRFDRSWEVFAELGGRIGLALRRVDVRPRRVRLQRALPGKRLLRVVAEPGAKLVPVAYGPLRAHALALAQ